jgi:hypothetical protein
MLHKPPRKLLMLHKPPRKLLMLHKPPRKLLMLHKPPRKLLMLHKPPSMALHDGRTVLSPKALPEPILFHNPMALDVVRLVTLFLCTSADLNATALCASSMELALSIVAPVLYAHSVSKPQPPKNLGKSALSFGRGFPTRPIWLLPHLLHWPPLARTKHPLSSLLWLYHSPHTRFCGLTGLVPVFVVNGFRPCGHKPSN